jgi:hypothetical protein
VSHQGDGSAQALEVYGARIQQNPRRMVAIFMKKAQNSALSAMIYQFFEEICQK